MTLPPSRGPLLDTSPLRHPNGVTLFEKPAIGPAEGVIICVHGSLDKAKSFARVARRLESFDVVAYDRRGYQDSRHLGASDELSFHVDDLLETCALVADRGPITVFGHSLGGVISITAALESPDAMGAVMAYESPMRWLIDDGPDWWTPGGDPEDQAESFFRRLTSNASWERLSDAERKARRSDGPALVADLTMVRTTIPFTAEQLDHLEVPVTVCVGGKSDHPRYRSSADVITAHAPEGQLAIVEGAAHGAHLTHPDGLAALIARVARSRGRSH